MIRPPVSLRRIPVFGFEHLGLHPGGAIDRHVDIVHLKPQQHSISHRMPGITQGTMMTHNGMAMQLKHQQAIVNQPLILRPAMIALKPQ